MEIKQTAVAGTMESSDIMVTMEPGKGSVEIDLQSEVDKQFGRQIRATIESTLTRIGVTNARVKAVDKGALDCTIKARVETAAYRAAGDENYQWKEAK
jgi:citrate lyase subunit gamma (acyl carrier protein)